MRNAQVRRDVTHSRRCENRVPLRNRVLEALSGKPRFHEPRWQSRSCRIRQVSSAALVRLRGSESGSWTWSKSARRMTRPPGAPMPHRPLPPIHPRSIGNHPITLLHEASFPRQMKCQGTMKIISVGFPARRQHVVTLSPFPRDGPALSALTKASTYC